MDSGAARALLTDMCGRHHAAARLQTVMRRMTVNEKGCQQKSRLFVIRKRVSPLRKRKRVSLSRAPGGVCVERACPAPAA